MSNPSTVKVPARPLKHSDSQNIDQLISGMPDIDQLFSGSEDINQLIQLLYQLLQKQELHKAAGIQKSSWADEGFYRLSPRITNPIKQIQDFNLKENHGNGEGRLSITNNMEVLRNQLLKAIMRRRRVNSGILSRRSQTGLSASSSRGLAGLG